MTLAEVLHKATLRDHETICWPAVRHLIADIEADPDFKLRERVEGIRNRCRELGASEDSPMLRAVAAKLDEALGGKP